MNDQMQLNCRKLCALAKISFVAFALFGLLTLSSSSRLLSQEKQPATAPKPQRTFPSPNEAAQALIRAAETNDVAALLEIFGADGEDLVATEDAVQDRNRATTFAAEAHEKMSIAIDSKKPDRAILIVGMEDWPAPIPIVKRNGVWIFDTKAGRQELLYRRIGANELDALQICRNYVAAQQEYALTKHAGSDVNQYAQKIISTPGKQDGLAWRNPDGSLGGPLAEGTAKALEEGYIDRAKPYHGYFFKILKGQGPAAPLGQMDFVVEGAMIGGFALAAAPADYRVTGVNTFIVGYQGLVYQKDLGSNTLTLFKEMERYNPDKTWKPTDDAWPDDAPETPPAAKPNSMNDTLERSAPQDTRHE